MTRTWDIMVLDIPTKLPATIDVQVVNTVTGWAHAEISEGGYLHIVVGPVGLSGAPARGKVYILPRKDPAPEGTQDAGTIKRRGRGTTGFTVSGCSSSYTIQIGATMLCAPHGAQLGETKVMVLGPRLFSFVDFCYA